MAGINSAASSKAIVFPLGLLGMAVVFDGVRLLERSSHDTVLKIAKC